MNTSDAEQRLDALRTEAMNPSGEAGVDRQHARGKLTARERIF